MYLALLHFEFTSLETKLKNETTSIVQVAENLQNHQRKKDVRIVAKITLLGAEKREKKNGA